MKRNKGTVAKVVKEMRNKADRADFDCCGNVDASFVRTFAAEYISVDCGTMNKVERARAALAEAAGESEAR